MNARRLLTAVCLIAVAVVVAACGVHHSNEADANNVGAYVKAGPVSYQLEVSRELNPYSSEDAAYLTGLSKQEATLAPDQEWYAVFLWAKNETKQTQQTTDNFVMTDTRGYKYYPVRLSNPYAWNSESLDPGGTEPEPNTTASYGPIGGQLVLFKVYGAGVNSVYSNRPLSLQIIGNTGKVWATISLDL